MKQHNQGIDPTKRRSPSEVEPRSALGETKGVQGAPVDDGEPRMRPRVTKRDVVWAFAAQFMQFGSSLLLLPVVLSRLSADELGMWYIYLTIWSFALLLDMTFSQTILRNVAYVYSGARVLLKTGIVPEERAGTIDFLLLFHLERTCRLIYGVLALVALVVMASAGTYYVVSVGGSINRNSLLISWGLFAASVIYRLAYAYLDPLLRGAGKIRQSNQSVFYSRAANLVVSLVAVLVGLGLVGVAAANLIACVLGRMLSNRMYYTASLRSEFSRCVRAPGKVRTLFAVMWYNSWRTGVVAAGTFFLTRSSTFLASVYLDLQATAQIGLCIQIMDLLTALSSVLANTYAPEFTALRKLGKSEELLKKFSVSWLAGLVTFACGSLAVLVAGSPLLALIHSHTSLLRRPALLLLMITYFLGLNHVFFANLISAKNEMPFVKPALLSGVVTLAATWLLLRFAAMGEMALVLSQLVVQLAYNNWKWPVVVLKEYRMTLVGIMLKALGVTHEYIRDWCKRAA